MQPKQQNSNQDSLRHRMHRYDAYNPDTSSAPRATTIHSQSAPLPQPVLRPPAQEATWQSQQSVPLQAPQTVPIVAPATQPVAEAPAFDYKYEQLPIKKSLFSSIVKASVEVERVTRQSVKAVKYSFEPPHIAAMRTRRQNLLVRAFYIVGGLSMVVSIFAVGHILLTSKQHTVEIHSVLGAQSTDTTGNDEGLIEEAPTAEDLKSYIASPQAPRYIRIDAINIWARVRDVGLDSKGVISAPTNINDAGWYDGSVRPGDAAGASIIVAHVTGPTAHGVFWDLNKLTVGSLIQVEKGNGEILRYKVSKMSKLSEAQVNLNQLMAANAPAKHNLKLITAAGKYDRAAGVYSDRQLIVAEPTQ